ncbi:MAG: hypothetical protein AABW56_03575 [Nanoarchaeota archaeon]
MRKLFLTLLVIIVIFLAGCTTNLPQNNDNNGEVCPQVCVPMYSTENFLCDYIECGSGCGPDNVTTFGTLEECQARVSPPIQEETTTNTKEFTVEGDDYGLYPETLSVNKGDNVMIIFKVRQDKVYYGGLDFRSDYFNTGKILPGGTITVEFTADQTFEYKSYWPASNALKATGTINVN